VDHAQRSARNAFVSATLDRHTDRRRDSAWIAARLADPDTRLLPVWRMQNAFLSGPDLIPAAFSPTELKYTPESTDPVIFLGEMDGQTYFALGLPDTETAPLAGRCEFRDLRASAPLLSQETGALIAYARAMVIWHQTHRHCGLCGHPTLSVDAGHVRRCTNPACSRQHFPRTDPAVIVLVTHEERCLLGRQAAWGPHRYSTIAGFVEPGESLEQAVAREVAEETGVQVGPVEYSSSQPWPFPASIMLGFYAQALNAEIHRQDNELEDVRWFSRQEITDGLKNGTLQTAMPVSIAFHLLEEWFDRESEFPLRQLLG
jgi:NAD+ diphosphatase